MFSLILPLLLASTSPAEPSTELCRPCCPSPLPYQLSYAYAIDDGEIRGAHVDTPRASMSVFKIFIAAAVLQHLDEGRTSLDTAIVIPKEEWEQDTWSPLQKKHRGTDASFSLAALLDATLIESDNIATDALIRHIGGLAGLNKTLAAMGMPDVAFHAMEREMQLSHSHAAKNQLSAKQVITLLRTLRRGKLLSPASTRELTRRMEACVTGREKIRAQFPASYTVGNRSGGSGRNAAGVKLGDNDAGYILLPDGRCLYLCIFINDSSASDADHLRLFQSVCQSATPQP